MSQAVCYHLKQFSFQRLHNGSVKIENATMESLALGLVLSQYLIHVEYYKVSTDVLITDVLIQVTFYNITRHVFDDDS